MNIAFSDTSKQDNDINDSLYTSHIHIHRHTLKHPLCAPDTTRHSKYVNTYI